MDQFKIMFICAILIILAALLVHKDTNRTPILHFKVTPHDPA